MIVDSQHHFNDKTRDAERHDPGRFIGAAHVHPLGGPEALRELACGGGCSCSFIPR